VQVGDLVQNRELFPPIEGNALGVIVSCRELTADPINYVIYKVWYGENKFSVALEQDLKLIRKEST